MASYENFERNWVCCGLFFTLSPCPAAGQGFQNVLNSANTRSLCNNLKARVAVVDFRKRFSKYSVSGSPSIFLISSKYRPNYLMRSTIVLSAAQENSVFLSVSARNQEIRDSRTSSILKILSGS